MSAASRPYTTARVAIRAGTTVRSRAVATLRSMRSVASVVQSVTRVSCRGCARRFGPAAYMAPPVLDREPLVGELHVDEPAVRAEDHHGVLPVPLEHIDLDGPAVERRRRLHQEFVAGSRVLRGRA